MFSFDEHHLHCINWWFFISFLPLPLVLKIKSFLNLQLLNAFWSAITGLIHCFFWQHCIYLLLLFVDSTDELCVHQQKLFNECNPSCNHHILNASLIWLVLFWYAYVYCAASILVMISTNPERVIWGFAAVKYSTLDLTFTFIKTK